MLSPAAALTTPTLRTHGSARSKGDRDIDDSVTILQDNIRVGRRPHLYLLDVARTDAAPLELSLEYGPVLRNQTRISYLNLLSAARWMPWRVGSSLDGLIRP